MLLNCGAGKDSWESLGEQGDQPWIFIGRSDAEAPILWPPNEKSWLIGKDPDAGKDWGQGEKEVTEDEMVFGITDSIDVSLSTLREIVRQRSLASCRTWNFRVRHNLLTEQQQLKNTLKNDFWIWKIPNGHLQTWFLKKFVKSHKNIKNRY